MAQVCLPAGCIDAIRIALVDQCSDNPVPGETNGYVFNCFRNVTLTKNIEDGDETVLKNDCGRKCFQTKKCDELKDVQIEFELLNPDYELINLLTGQSLINNGGENIGWYQTEGDNCTPWVSVELFEQVPDESCSAGHKYRRLVLPKVRFKLPTDEKEDPFRLVKFEGRTSPAELAAWGIGPFGDSPFDFSSVPSGTQSHYMEFFDDSILETLAGQCGFITVPAGGDGGGNPEIADVSEYGDSTIGNILIEGNNLSGLGTVRAYYDGGASYVQWDNPPGSPGSLTLQSDVLAGQTITMIELYSDFPPTNLLLAYTGPQLPLVMQDFIFYFSYDSGLDELTITNTVGYNFNNVDNIDFVSNGNVTLNTGDWYLNSSSEMVITNAAVVLNSGPVTEFQMKNGGTNLFFWADYLDGAGYPTGSIYLI